jgi:hypothetical protein
MGLLNGTTQREYYQGNEHGGYQFTSLEDIINQFMIVYVGEDKIIPKAKRLDVAFHAQRAMQELSFDTFKSIKSQEITLPPSNTMILPQDYVNYTKVCWVDSSGIKHLLYPISKTSNPTKPQVDSDDDFLFDSSGNLIPSGNLIANGNFIGGSEGWALNETNFSAGTLTSRTATTLTATETLGDPDVGWFYGFDGNSIAAYDLPAGEYWGIRQSNIPIISGEKYKITYTLSGYTSGSWKWYIIDGEGNSSGTTEVTANGTYEETITAGGTDANYAVNTVFFRNESTTATGNVVIDNISIVRVGDEETSSTWTNYKSSTPSENQDDYQDDTYWPNNQKRYGLDPQHAQVNGSFYIDNLKGLINFSSNISGKTVILDYISDSLGTDGEMQVHKFAEEAMYRWILHAIAAGRMQTQQLVPRLKKEKIAAIRQAKLRLSNIKLEELTQILRGKSKHIKH